MTENTDAAIKMDLEEERCRKDGELTRVKVFLWNSRTEWIYPWTCHQLWPCV